MYWALHGKERYFKSWEKSVAVLQKLQKCTALEDLWLMTSKTERSKCDNYPSVSGSKKTLLMDLKNKYLFSVL